MTNEIDKKEGDKKAEEHGHGEHHEHAENHGHTEHHKAQHHHGPEHEGKPPVFTVQIDKELFEFRDPTPTGRDLLLKAGKTPVENFAIYQKLKGNQPKRISLEEKVDLREPGVERFVTLPLDQTEG